MKKLNRNGASIINKSHTSHKDFFLFFFLSSNRQFRRRRWCAFLLLFLFFFLLIKVSRVHVGGYTQIFFLFSIKKPKHTSKDFSFYHLMAVLIYESANFWLLLLFRLRWIRIFPFFVCLSHAAPFHTHIYIH